MRRKEINVDVEEKTCLKSIPHEIKETTEESVGLSDSELMSALEYFHPKSTLQIKEFRKKKEYENISMEVDEILYYKGRIILEQKVSGVKDMCDVMVDL